MREWRPLAEQGNADAQCALGGMYGNGQGVLKASRNVSGASTQFDYVYWDEKRQECVAQASISGVHKGEPLAGNIFGQLAGFEYMDGEFKEKYFSMQMPNMPYE